MFTNDENSLSYKKVQRKAKHAYHHNLTNVYILSLYTYILYMVGFPGGAAGKEPICQCRYM